MESPCTNHTYPIKHFYKDYELKRFYDRLAGRRKERARRQRPRKEARHARMMMAFPDPEECLMIFGGSDAIYSRHQHKVRYREACVAETVVPSFLS